MSNDKKREFTIVYKQYFKYIYSYIYHRVPTYEDTEDIVSTVFTALWESWDNLDPQNNIKSWIFSIAHHKLNDFLRKKYNLTSKLGNVDFDKVIEEVDLQAKKNSYKKILINLIDKLDKNDKKFIILKYNHNYTYSEISEELNITVNNAKVKNNRLIKKLKKLWENYEK